MANIIKVLRQGANRIFPRTLSQAVIMEDTTSLEYAIKHIPTDSVLLTDEVATAYGVPSGTSLSTILMNRVTSTNNVLASAELIE